MSRPRRNVLDKALNLCDSNDDPLLLTEYTLIIKKVLDKSFDTKGQFVANKLCHWPGLFS